MKVVMEMELVLEREVMEMEMVMEMEVLMWVTDSGDGTVVWYCGIILKF